MSTTTNLLVTEIAASQSQKEVTANNAFQAFDKAIAGKLAQAITSADVTLSDADARNAIIELSGTLTGNRNLIVPTRTKIYAVYNGTSGAYTVTVKTSGGTGVVVSQGTREFVYCDGTNVVRLAQAGLVVEEVDASPSVSGVTKIVVTNGSLTDDGSGQVTISTGGGSGDVTEQGAYGSRPSADNDGDLYFSTDGAVVSRDKGSGNGYSHWGPVFLLNMSKTVSDFAWINQETATATDTAGGIVMTPPVGTGSSINLLKRTAPSTPYTITAGGILNAVGTNSLRMGLCFRQSSDGKIVYHAFGYGGSNWKIEGFKFTNATTYAGATYYSYEWMPTGGFCWLRIGDDGTDRKVWISSDGQNWALIHSVGRTDYLTADEVGIAVDCNNASIICVANWLHYVEA